MKRVKITFLALITLMIGANVATAQVKDNAIKWNAIGVLSGQYNFAYERALNESMSVQLGVGYISRGWEFVGYKQQTSGFMVVPEARYYFNESMKGLYGAAFARIRSTTFTSSYDDTSIYDYGYTQTRFAVGGGVVIGVQVLAGDVFVFDIFAGPQYKAVSSTITYNDATYSNPADIWNPSPFGLRFGFNIGAAF